MNKQIGLILKDLALLKDEMPITVMIGQLKVKLNKSQNGKGVQSASWHLRKRHLKDETFYRVKFSESHALLEAVFISTDVKPKVAESSGSSKASDGELCITSKDIEKFIVEANDPNTIHRGERPVVPGLLILERLLDALSDATCLNSNYQIKFLEPLFANESFTIKKMEKTFHILNMLGDSIAVLTLEGKNE